MVAIVDYGMGNLRSVYHALENLGVEPTLCSQPEQLADAERVILPGVGAIRDCMAELTRRRFVEQLRRLVLDEKKPFLGICLGMQVLATRCYEGGIHDGLGWVEGEVVRLNPAEPELRVPHVGWDDVALVGRSPLFERLPESPEFYFTHSYHFRPSAPEVITAVCDYGEPVTASIRQDNILAVQFHPEKSQDLGLKVLENFLNWDPSRC